MASLVLLRGNSGSGKTSLAKLLQERFGPNTMRLSHDMIRMDMLHVRGREGAEKSLPLLFALLEYGRAHCETVVLEGILPTGDYCPLFEAAQRLYGERIFAYYYDLSFEETLRRHATKPNRNDFGESDMRRWWQERDFIGFLPEALFSEEISLEDAAARIVREVTDG